MSPGMSKSGERAALAGLSPREMRQRIAAGSYRGPTAGLCPGFVQANLVVLPAVAAAWFSDYCARNPKPCPLLERLAAGDSEPKRLAPGADVRTDLPRYRLYRPDGQFAELDEITHLYDSECVAFLLGCSFTFEEALRSAGMVPRHVEEGVNVPMYRTSRPTIAAGPFAGPLVVSMRPVLADRVGDAYAVTAPFVAAHGAPVHDGDATVLGIREITAPEWGDPVTVHPGEVPVFWACGVTSQEAVTQALASGAVPWAITHAPGHMFICDLRGDALRVG